MILTPTQGQTPYNAPTYFPVSYFYGGATAAVDPTSGSTPYNAPTYFPPTYFYNGSTPAAPPIGRRATHSGARRGVLHRSGRIARERSSCLPR